MRALLFAALSVFVAAASPAMGQVLAVKLPDSGAQAKSKTLVIPAPESCRSLWAQVTRVKSVDIPQWAKDEGHNGRSTFSATVGSDGELASLDLVKSSGSEALDEAVEQRAKTLEYRPAIDADCNPTQGQVRFTMSYARFDKDSPGGGLGDYTCGHMLREYDWFARTKADGNLAFIPQLAFIIAGSMVRLERGEDLSSAVMDAEAEKRNAMWETLVKRCRTTPDTLLLDEIDHREMFRQQVDNR